jgi:hypothetical protein
VSYSTGPYLLAKVSFRAATCPVAPDPAFLIGRAPAPSRVSWPQALPPCKGGLWCVTCPTAPNPASIQGRAPMRHVSCSFRSCLSTSEGSSAPHVLQLRILPPYRGGLRSAACPMALDPASLSRGLRCRHHMPYGFLWAAGLQHKEKPMQLGLHVSNAHAHVLKAFEVRAIMGLKDVRTGNTFNVCKTCGHVAIVWL